MMNATKPTLNPPDLGFLLDGLRQQGFVVGIGDMLEIHRYFDILWGQQDTPLSISDLKAQLAALVCQNFQQQQQFYTWFDKWAAIIQQRTANIIDALKQTEATVKDATDVKNEGTTNKPIDKPIPPSPTTPVTELPTGDLLPKSFQKSRKGPINIQLTFPIKSMRFWNLADMDAVLLVLREKKWANSTEWDIPASIRQTIQLGGIPEFVLKQKKQTPQYLMLIEQQSNRDHQAAFYAELAEELGRRDLNVSFFYYDITPNICWRERNNPRTHVSLEQLQGEYADARLFIVGSAETLLKTAQLEPSSAAISIWETWKETAILNPKATGDWGKAELAIGQLFPVIPINSLGFKRLAEQWNGSEHFTPAYWQIHYPEPRTPLVAEFDTLPRFEMPMLTPDVENNLNLLYFYLRDSGYRWLCATALYPELYYELTHLYANKVITPNPKLGELAQNQLWWESLRLLVRLDWFRKGHIQTYWRYLLREDFTVEQALLSESPQFVLSVEASRKALLNILELPENTEGIDKESYAAANQAFTKVWLESEIANNVSEIPQKMEDAGIYMSDIEDGVGQRLWHRLTEKEVVKRSEKGKTLYAVIIGIDNYPTNVRKLQGCVNDATAFDAYLKQFSAAQNITYSTQRLLGEQATRLNVIHSFNHFDQAQDGDICIFYFAGYGSQMKTLPQFSESTDGFSDTLVCFDSRMGAASCHDLVGKELGYLIYKATKGKKVHFLSITDCSYKLVRTRGFENYSTQIRAVEPNSVTNYAFEDAEGFEVWKKSQFRTQNNVSLEATNQFDSAKEMFINEKWQGVFTYALIEALEKSGGKISYKDLIAQVNIKALVEGQTPSLFINGMAADTPFLGIVSKEFKTDPLSKKAKKAKEKYPIPPKALVEDAILGFDIYHGDDIKTKEEWQEAAKVYKFVYLKASEGSTIQDKRFNEFAEKATSVNILKGGYHFYRLLNLDVDAQVTNFLHVLQSTKQPLEMPPLVEIEPLPKEFNEPLKSQLIAARETIVQNIRQFLNELEQRTNSRPVIYTTHLVWNDFLGNPKGFDNYPLFVADYSELKEPRIPISWKNYTFWQYSEKGKVAGQEGYDMNVFNGNAVDFQRFIKESMRVNIQPQAEKPEVDKPDSIKKHFLDLISDGKLKEALDLMREIGDTQSSYFSDPLILLQSRFNRNENENNNGLISPADYRIERNRIENAAQSLIEGELDERKIPASFKIEQKKIEVTKKSKIYFSYAWNENNREVETKANTASDISGKDSTLIKQLSESFKVDGYDVINDVSEETYKGSLIEFIKEIGRADFIIVVISDKFLKSEFCMYELYEMLRKDIFKKIYLIYTEIIDLSNPEISINYFKYWEDTKKRWEQLITNYGKHVPPKQQERYQQVKDIRNELGSIIAFLNDLSGTLKVKLSENNFSKVKETIKKQFSEREVPPQ